MPPLRPPVSGVLAAGARARARWCQLWPVQLPHGAVTPIQQLTPDNLAFRDLAAGGDGARTPVDTGRADVCADDGRWCGMVRCLGGWVDGWDLFTPSLWCPPPAGGQQGKPRCRSASQTARLSADSPPRLSHHGHPQAASRHRHVTMRSFQLPPRHVTGSFNPSPSRVPAVRTCAWTAASSARPWNSSSSAAWLCSSPSSGLE